MERVSDCPHRIATREAIAIIIGRKGKREISIHFYSAGERVNSSVDSAYENSSLRVVFM